MHRVCGEKLSDIEESTRERKVEVNHKENIKTHRHPKTRIKYSHPVNLSSIY